MPDLRIGARRVHVFPALHHSALVSTSQFCNDDFEAQYTKQYVHILKSNRVAMQGQCTPFTGLWQIFLEQKMQTHDHAANNVYELNK